MKKQGFYEKKNKYYWLGEEVSKKRYFKLVQVTSNFIINVIYPKYFKKNGKR